MVLKNANSNSYMKTKTSRLRDRKYIELERKIKQIYLFIAKYGQIDILLVFEEFLYVSSRTAQKVCNASGMLLTFDAMHKKYIDEMEIVKSPELTDLKAASCGLKKFTIDGGKNLKSLNLGNNELTSLNLPPVNFPVLMSLNCGDNKITALNLPPENFPALMSLNCENNKITALVPKIFDWIKSSGGRVSYDKRYEYKNCVMVKDNGVGFWYPGEPESGCHAAKCDCQPPK